MNFVKGGDVFQGEIRNLKGLPLPCPALALAICEL